VPPLARRADGCSQASEDKDCHIMGLPPWGKSLRQFEGDPASPENNALLRRRKQVPRRQAEVAALWHSLPMESA